jgi:hypothetical protein
MKKIVLLFSFLLIILSALHAQIPDWKVNEPAYQYTMTMVSKLNIDGVQLTNSNDMVAAFVGATCRGVSKLTYVASANSYYAYLTILSNTPGEAITFYLYNSKANKVIKVSKTINFSAYQNIGNLFQSFSIAEPALNDKADVLTFDFLNIKTLFSSINQGQIKLNISESYPLNNLTPVFTLSKGAILLKNRIPQSSGKEAINFLAPINYEVLSEDESTLNMFTVNVTQVIDPPLFYKKDAVCAALGAIKIVSKREGTVAQLSYNGKQIDSKPVTNGVVIFSGLLSGTYIASIGTDVKSITINLKVN